MSAIIVKSYKEPPFNEREVLRYAGCREGTAEVQNLLFECWQEAKDKLSYLVCYTDTELTRKEQTCQIEGFAFHSSKLSQILASANRVVVFCATVGVELDRLIGKYAKLSPTKAVIFQAIGAERIEAVCDCFCKELQEEKGIFLTPRFSSGYGDLALETQKQIFALLQPEKRIGVCLNNSMLMSPSKSVTAIMGYEYAMSVLK